MGIKFRLLRANEIEVRTQQTTENGTSVLLYKTARTDANLLDETVGAENWQNDFKSIDGKMFGYISIKCDGEWVTKSDSGTEGNIEAEKSLASDAFKRAGFKWGIGRELYTAPFIWIDAKNIQIKNVNGRYFTNEKFSVSKIKYNQEKEICFLEIVNDKNKVIYTFAKLSSECQTEINDAQSIEELKAIYEKYATTEPLQQLKDVCAMKKTLLKSME